jgi:protein gp37
LWWGCEEVSPACDHCYAKTLATRYGFDVWGLDKPRRLFKDAHYNEPLGWNAKAERAGERRRVFVNSMADIGEQHPNAEMAEYLDTARHDYFTRIVPHTPWLDHLLLTKRPTNYKDILPADWVTNGCPPNVWLGITAENQHWFDIRIAALFSVPAQRVLDQLRAGAGRDRFQLATRDGGATRGRFPMDRRARPDRVDRGRRGERRGIPRGGARLVSLRAQSVHRRRRPFLV